MGTQGSSRQQHRSTTVENHEVRQLPLCAATSASDTRSQHYRDATESAATFDGTSLSGAVDIVTANKAKDEQLS